MNFANPSRSPLRTLNSYQEISTFNNPRKSPMRSFTNADNQELSNLLQQSQASKHHYTDSTSQIIRQVTSIVPTTTISNINVMKRSMSGTTINGSQMINQAYQNQRPQVPGTDVACFLMVLEIERLLVENERLKFRLQDIEDKLLDRNSYEQQIIDLQARLQEMVYNEHMMRIQYEQTTTMITTLEMECHTWREKTINLEQRYSCENDEIRIQTQQKNKELEELRGFQLTILQFLLKVRLQSTGQWEVRARDLESKIGMLVCETERLNNLLRSKLEEIESLKIKYQRSEQRVHELQKSDNENQRLVSLLDSKQKDLNELKEYIKQKDYEINQLRGQEQYVIEIQNKTVLLTNEIERLNLVLKDKIQQMDEWRRKYQQSEQQSQELRTKVQKIDTLQVQLSELNQTLSSNQQQMEQSVSKNNQIQSYSQKLQQELDKVKQLVQEYQSKLSLATQEIERLNQIVQQRLIEREEQHNKSNQLMNQNKQLESEIRERQQKNESLNVQVQQKERKLVEYENRIALLSQECERLNSVILTKVKEYEENKSNQAAEAQRFKQISAQRQQELDEWLSKYRRLEATFNEYRGVEERVQHYQIRVILLSTEVERLGLVNGRINADNEELVHQFENYQQTIKQRDEQIFKGIERSNLLQKLIDEEKGKVQRVEHSLGQYQDRCSGFDQRSQSMQIEVERVNQILRQKSQEYDDMKQRTSMVEMQVGMLPQLQMKLRDYEQKIVLVTQENERLSGMMTQIRNERDELLQRLGQASQWQVKLRDYEQKIVLITQENERLNGLVQQLKSEREDFQQRLGAAQQWQAKLRDYESKVILVTSENEKLNSLVSQLRNEKDEIFQKSQSKDQRLNSSLQQSEDLRIRYSHLETQLQQSQGYKIRLMELENKVVLLTSEIERLNQIINQKTHEIEGYKQSIVTFETTIFSYQSFEENVRILSNEIDRLNMIIEQQENELKLWRLQFADGSHHQKRLQELHFTLVLSFAEIESLRARVIEKEREVDEVRRSSLAPYRR